MNTRLQLLLAASTVWAELAKVAQSELDSHRQMMNQSGPDVRRQLVHDMVQLTDRAADLFVKASTISRELAREATQIMIDDGLVEGETARDALKMFSSGNEAGGSD